MASTARDQFGRLPSELVCLVAKDPGLMNGDLAALAATCRKFHARIIPILYKKHLEEGGHAPLTQLNPVMWAVTRLRFDTITRFLENGAAINEDRMYRAYWSDLPGWSVIFEYHELSLFTPLALAAALGRDSMVEFLLDRGADIEKPGKGLCDCCSGNDELCLAFPPDGCGCCLGDQDFIMDDMNGAGWTPLHFALCRKHESTAIVLLERGADPQVTCPCDMGPWNALHTATRLNQRRIIDYLLDNELVDINHAGFEGLTPLFLAFYDENYFLVDMYIDRGADINAVWKSSDGGWTIFGVACMRDDLSRASDLLQLGADPDLNLTDYHSGNDWTALGLIYGNLFRDYLRTCGNSIPISPNAANTLERQRLEEQIIQIKVDRALKQQQQRKEEKD